MIKRSIALYSFISFIVLLSATLAGCNPVGQNNPHSRTKLDKWQYQYTKNSEAVLELKSEQPLNHSIWHDSKKLINPPGKIDPSALWMRIWLPQRNKKQVMYFPKVHQGFLVVLDKQCFYQFALEPAQDGNACFNQSLLKENGYPVHFMEIPAGQADWLYVKILSNHINIGPTALPALAENIEIHKLYLIKENAARGLVAFFLFILGLLLLAVYGIGVRNIRALYMAAVVLLTSIYFLTRMDIKQFLLDAPVFWTLLELYSLYLIIPTLYLFTRSMLNSKISGILIWLAAVHLTYTLVSASLVFLKIIPVMATLLPVQVSIVTGVLFTTILAIYESFKNNIDARFMAIGLLIIYITTILDIVRSFQWVAIPTDISPFGTMLFLLILSGSLLRRLLESHKQLKVLTLEQDRLVSERTQALKISHDEIHKLNEFTQVINANPDLDEVLDQIFDYFKQVFQIEAVILQLVDNEKRELYTYKTTAPENASQAMLNYSRQLRVPLNKESGVIYRTCDQQKIFYASRIDARLFPDGMDREIIDNLKLNSFMLVPLIIQNEVLAMLMLTSYDKPLQLQLHQRQSIARFCEQISGAVHSANLLKSSMLARLHVEKISNQNRKLNWISKEISQNTNLDENLDMIFSFVQINYPIDSMVIFLRDESNDNSLVLYKTVFPDHLNQAELTKKMVNKKISLGQEENSYSSKLAYRQKPLYLPRFRNKGGTTSELSDLEMLGVKSLFTVPLVSQNRIVGIIHFSNMTQGMQLSREERSGLVRFCEQMAGAIRTTSLLKAVESERQNADKLLLNLLPEQIAVELKAKGFIKPRSYSAATVLFTDFQSFSRIAHDIPPDELLVQLDQIFELFDNICSQHKLEKLKTIGDSYMCVGGLPEANKTHPVDSILAALAMQNFITETAKLKKDFHNEDFWKMRLGIHTGPVVAGVIGKHKFAYDVWGDTVNIASRMESSGEPGKVNISRHTYDLVKDFFECQPRGVIEIKNHDPVEMFFVVGIKTGLNKDATRLVPNEDFYLQYSRLETIN